MPIPPIDQLDRTTLLLMHRHNLSFEDAQTFKDSTTLWITASAAVCSTREGQAALTTAVAVGVRAFGNVEVFLDDVDRVVAGGTSRGMTLGEVVRAEGAHIRDDSDADAERPSASRLLTESVTLRAPAICCPAQTGLLATWSDWTATVDAQAWPTTAGKPPDTSSGSGNILSAIAAAALAVSEAFLKVFIADPASDAGSRRVGLNLYAPNSSKKACDQAASTPHLSYAPASWWLLGLGHLGQAHAHVIAWLEYVDSNAVEVVMQDTDKATPANHSTGVLTAAETEEISKTRMVAAKLENAGLATRIIEQRLDELSVRRPQDMHTALIGVDNLYARRLISRFSWNTAIDVGLGADLADFDGITLRRFPGSIPSDQVPAWQEQPASAPDTALPDNAAIRAMHAADPCGALVVAGTAVGVSFVGVVAACLAVSEAMRDLHGGAANAVVTYSLAEADMRAVTAAGAETAIAVEVRSDPSSSG